MKQFSTMIELPDDAKRVIGIELTMISDRALTYDRQIGFKHIKTVLTLTDYLPRGL